MNIKKISDTCYFYENGKNKRYYFDEKGTIFHRVDGPAYISDESEEWYFMDKLHCESGPAIRNKKNGLESYYLDDVRYSKSEYEAIMSARKPSYGATCIKCKNTNEYVLKKNDHVCYSCKSYERMYE